MRWVTARGFICLTAQVLLVSASALAADSFYSTSPVGTGSGSGFQSSLLDSSTSSLSNPAIDRLLIMNDHTRSVARSTSVSVLPEEMKPAREKAAATESALIAEASSTPSRGYMVLTACGAIFALGIGLCCAGVMSGRQRTMTTFSAGFVHFK